MKIHISDFNSSDAVINRRFASAWTELAAAMNRVPLHVKKSDQEGKQGELIFNPVGTNQALKDELEAKDWNNIPLPDKYSFFGLGLDFGKGNVCVEAQFSNYPFLLNNTLRAEVLFRDAHPLVNGNPLQLLVIITKMKHFPASNSTLYYEQAVEHLKGLSTHKLFSVPTRVVGLDVTADQCNATLTNYSSARYSRTIARQQEISIVVQRSTKRSGISKFTKL